jgi:hypothetical protein
MGSAMAVTEQGRQLAESAEWVSPLRQGAPGNTAVNTACKPDQATKCRWEAVQ